MICEKDCLNLKELLKIVKRGSWDCEWQIWLGFLDNQILYYHKCTYGQN